jgi:hypothetical protein
MEAFFMMPGICPGSKFRYKGWLYSNFARFSKCTDNKSIDDCSKILLTKISKKNSERLPCIFAEVNFLKNFTFRATGYGDITNGNFYQLFTHNQILSS